MCPNSVPHPILPTPRFLGSGNGEGVRNWLSQTLTAGNSYTLRFKYAMSSQNGGYKIFLTRWGEHWRKKPKKNHNQKFSVGTFKGAGLFSDGIFHADAWTSVSIPFTVPNHYNAIENLVFFQDGGYEYIDDVEILEGDCEHSDFYTSNKLYTVLESTFEFQHIFSGTYAYTPDPGDVTVDVGGDVTYKAGAEVTLQPGFEALNGSEFHAYIAPCGSSCPYPVASAGGAQDICDGQPIQLGSYPQPNLTYTWSSPNGALPYLSATNIANPVFTPPSGAGYAAYVLTVSNTCGGASTDEITIFYDNNPAPGGDGGVFPSHIIGPNNIQFAVFGDSHTESMEIEMYDNTTGEYINTFDIDNWPQMASSGGGPGPFASFNTHYNFSTPDIYNPCHLYRFDILSENICADNSNGGNLVGSVLWDPSPNLAITNTPSVFTPNGDGCNDNFCWGVVGANHYEADIYVGNGGSHVYHASGPLVSMYSNCGGTVTTLNACVWDGSCNQTCGTQGYGGIVCDGTYFYVITFSNDCENNPQSVTVANYVTLFGSCPAGSGRLANPGQDGEQAAVSSTDGGTTDMAIYPNPARVLLHVSYADFAVSNNKISSMEIYDCTGRLVYANTNVNLSNEISLSNFENGIYTLVSKGERQMLRRSFVVQK